MKFCSSSKRIFLVSGLFSAPDLRSRLFQRVCLFIVLFVETYELICDIAAFLFVEQNVIERCTTFQHVMLHINSWAKAMLLVYYSKTFISLWNKLDEIYVKYESNFYIPGSISLNIPEKISNTGNKLLLLILITMMTFYSVTPFFRSETEYGKPLPLISVSYSFYDVNISPNYEITYIFQLIFALFAMNYGLCWWSQFLSLIAHCNQKLIILQYLFRNLKCRDNIKNEQESLLNLANQTPIIENMTEITETIKLLDIYVKYHVSVLSFCGEVQKLSTYFILVEVLCGISFYCVGSYIIVKSPISEALPIIALVLILLSVMYFHCWISSQLANESLAVADAAYDCDLGSTSSEIRRTLTLVVLRAQKPVLLTVGPFGVIDLNTFVSVMQFTYSNFMFLRQMEEAGQK